MSSSDIGNIGWETKYKDVREGTNDIRQGQETGTEAWVTGEQRKNSRGAPK